MTDRVRNVVVIGSGPAGLTAAIYAARANLDPLCIEGFNAGGLVAGGQLMFTTEVENYPGFPNGVQGPDMMRLFREQAARFGTELLTEDVTKVDLRERPFTVWVGDKKFRSQAVIVATGASARYLGLPSEEALKNKGVSACATCDGALFRGQNVAVVGGGDTAMEEATFLTRLCANVTVIHRRDTLRASKVMQDRAKKNDKIRFVWDTAVTEVHDSKKGHVTGLTLQNVKTGAISHIEVGALFVAIGHQPNTALFKGQLDMNAAGYLETKPHSTATNVAGVFAAGDVADHVYRQAVTAAGTGCMAALDAERWLAAHVDG